MRVLEALAFGSCAAVLHVAAFALVTLSEAPGSVGGGDGGAADATVLATGGQIAALVARWQQSPDAVQAVAAPVPPRSDVAPRRDTPQAPVPRRLAQPGTLVATDTAEGRTAPAPDLPAPPPPAPAALVAPESLAALPVPRPDALASPRLPDPATPRLVAPAPMRRPDAAREAAPQAMTQTARALTDPTNTASLAPDRSARPALRPDTLAPPPQARPAKARPSGPQPAPPARAAQRAKGAGATAAPAPKAQVRTQPKAQAGPSAGQVQAAQAQWGAQIRSAVARAQRYPGNTRATGRATVRLDVAPSGQLRAVRLVQSSGHSALDQAALTAARRARLPRAPGILRAASYSFNLPLSFARR
ncbi:energy transducer TonB [Roseivivax sp. CAU 1753]